MQSCFSLDIRVMLLIMSSHARDVSITSDPSRAHEKSRRSLPPHILVNTPDQHYKAHTSCDTIRFFQHSHRCCNDAQKSGSNFFLGWVRLKGVKVNYDSDRHYFVLVQTYIVSCLCFARSNLFTGGLYDLRPCPFSRHAYWAASYNGWMVWSFT